MSEYPTERNGQGRRKSDEECAAHEERLDNMDAEIHKQSGWLKAAAGFWAVAIIIASSFCTVIISHLNTIENLLTDNKVALMQHSEQIKALDCRIKDIEERHKYEDQQRERK